MHGFSRGSAVGHVSIRGVCMAHGSSPWQLHGDVQLRHRAWACGKCSRLVLCTTRTAATLQTNTAVGQKYISKHVCDAHRAAATVQQPTHAPLALPSCRGGSTKLGMATSRGTAPPPPGPPPGGAPSTRPSIKDDLMGLMKTREAGKADVALLLAKAKVRFQRQVARDLVPQQRNPPVSFAREPPP